jgi:hypothetical protein
MSFDAVNQVTRFLRMLLHNQLILASADSTAVVTLLPPGDELPDVAGVNLYLYRVVESPSTRNQDWRGDRVTPPSSQPILALQLYYLLTPLGAPPEQSSFTAGDDAHTMLGMAMQTLFDHPILNDVHLPGLHADVALPDSIRNSYERIKVTLLPTSLDEVSKIWATINQPYRLSVAYEVSLVELTPTRASDVPAGAVGNTAVRVGAPDPPLLTNLVPSSGPLASVGPGGILQPSTLTLLGSGLTPQGQSPQVQVGGKPAAVLVSSPPSGGLTVLLPTDLDAGPQADVQVAVAGRSGLPLSFTVTPWLQQITPIRTALDPSLGSADLSVSLSGTGFSIAPQAVRFEGPAPAPTTTMVTAFTTTGDTSASVAIPGSIVNGIYRVRIIRSDGGVSNSRPIEVIPRIDPPVVASTVVNAAGSTVNQLTINGARLAGKDLRLILDGVEYQLAATAGQASQLIAEIGLPLSSGSHTIAVMIDGHRSRTVTQAV